MVNVLGPDIGQRLGRRAERELIAACAKHLEKIASITGQFNLLVDAYCNCDASKVRYYTAEVNIREKEADAIKGEIIDNLMESSLHPMDQDEIIRLVLTSDDIAAYLKSASRRLSCTDAGAVPVPIKAGLKEITGKLVEETAALMDTIDALSDNSGDVTDKAEKTERLEEMIDDLRVDLLAQILKWGDTAQHVSDWLMIKETVESIESSSDKVEDTADVIRAIAVLRRKR